MWSLKGGTIVSLSFGTQWDYMMLLWCLFEDLISDASQDKKPNIRSQSQGLHVVKLNTVKCQQD